MSTWGSPKKNSPSARGGRFIIIIIIIIIIILILYMFCDFYL